MCPTVSGSPALIIQQNQGLSNHTSRPLTFPAPRWAILRRICFAPELTSRLFHTASHTFGQHQRSEILPETLNTDSSTKQEYRQIIKFDNPAILFLHFLIFITRRRRFLSGPVWGLTPYAVSRFPGRGSDPIKKSGKALRPLAFTLYRI